MQPARVPLPWLKAAGAVVAGLFAFGMVASIAEGDNDPTLVEVASSPTAEPLASTIPAPTDTPPPAVAPDPVPASELVPASEPVPATDPIRTEPASAPEPQPEPVAIPGPAEPQAPPEAGTVHYENCAAARAAGAAPVRTGDRGYAPHLDADGDGVGCENGGDAPGSAEPAPVPAGTTYYRNCTAARAAGAAPVGVGDPGYGRHLDRDGDGVGCAS